MAYSVMVWLVAPGEQAHQQEAMQRTTTGRAQAPVLLRALTSPRLYSHSIRSLREPGRSQDGSL